MKSCFLFGHKDAPEDILDRLSTAIIRHHLELSIHTFVVGHYGAFDHAAMVAAQKVKTMYSDAHFLLLTPYHPSVRSVELPEGFDSTLYLEGMEESIPKLAIIRANQLMIQRVNSIICYVNHPGNSRNLLGYANKRAEKESLYIENLAIREKYF